MVQQSRSLADLKQQALITIRTISQMDTGAVMPLRPALHRSLAGISNYNADQKTDNDTVICRDSVATCHAMCQGIQLYSAFLLS